MLPDDSQTIRKPIQGVDPQQGPTSKTAPDQASLQTGSILKEKELIKKQEESYIEEIGKELELEKEVKEAGVEKIGEEITLPEPVKSLGVEGAPSLPVSPPSQNLPLTQTQIKKALHRKVIDSILWLAYWCLRQFKIQNKKNKTTTEN